MALDAETHLSIRLSAIMSRNRFTSDPAPVIDELRTAAGTHTELLSHEAGSWVGYYGDDYTRTLCEALLEIEGAPDWVAEGEYRRGKAARWLSPGNDEDAPHPSREG